MCPSLPEQVTDALLALSQARQRYRLEHAAAQRSAGASPAAVLPAWLLQTPP